MEMNPDPHPTFPVNVTYINVPLNARLKKIFWRIIEFNQDDMNS